MRNKTRWRSILDRLALFVLLASCTLWVGPSEKLYLDAMRRGDTHAAGGERTASVTAYLEATRILPGEPTGYLSLAQIYLDWGRLPAAEKSLLQAEAVGASESDVVRLRLGIARQRGEWATIVRLGVPLLEESPSDQSLRRTLAAAYLELQAWDAARQQYALLSDSDPTDAMAQERLGILTLGELEAPQHLAIAGTELSAQILDVLADPDAAQNPTLLHLAVGRVLLDAGEWSLAIREFERALSVDWGPAEAYAYLGFALDQVQRFDDALEVLEQAVLMAPESVLAHTLLGVHHDLLGDTRAARAEYEMAYDRDPENAALCIEIGGTWAVEGQHTVAEVWYEEAARLAPGDSAVWQALASFYIDYGVDIEGKGIDAAEMAVALAPDSAAAHELAGRAWFELRSYDLAEGALRRALELEPEPVSAEYYLAQVLEAQGERVEAEHAFSRALDLDADGRYCELSRRAMAREPVQGAFDCR